MKVAETDRTFYVQRSKYGFYCDSEWDGDSFCADPLSAYMRTESWVEGRGATMYECVKIIVHQDIYNEHLQSPAIPVQCAPKGKKQIRWKCKCSRCGMSTKNYAEKETALTRYALDCEQRKCIVTTWKYAKEAVE